MKCPKGHEKEKGKSCVECHRIYSKSYMRTREGIARKRFSSVKGRTKKHEWPELEYTKEWFLDWALSSEDFNRLYDNWVRCDFIKALSPSIDRIDPTKYYNKDNIRWIPWKDNWKKGNLEQNSRVDFKFGEEQEEEEPCF